eukprot:COSAG06_NODE_1546_length_9134_cov_2.183951_2_plen_73_part_00
MSRQITKDANEILGDGAFDASAAAVDADDGAEEGADNKVDPAVAEWLKSAPEALRSSEAFAAISKAASGKGG